jgi:hypothetical protein
MQMTLIFSKMFKTMNVNIVTDFSVLISVTVILTLVNTLSFINLCLHSVTVSITLTLTVIANAKLKLLQYIMQ